MGDGQQRSRHICIWHSRNSQHTISDSVTPSWWYHIQVIDTHSVFLGFLLLCPSALISTISADCCCSQASRFAYFLISLQKGLWSNQSTTTGGKESAFIDTTQRGGWGWGGGCVYFSTLWGQRRRAGALWGQAVKHWDPLIGQHTNLHQYTGLVNVGEKICSQLKVTLK